ncbi:MAG: HD domain-containing phosphohydrolase [Thermovirgaceae bacterium]|nr:diguanylate cyclase [Synergistales bacterium]HPC76468.1 diguanylate cyclase [Synergistales bacterium]HRS48936.1 diguanylate cyclase [Thermovirgaceae bacterium]HRU91243.1 diguanylate cyclase [Thermovirgaceae bacterium]
MRNWRNTSTWKLFLYFLAGFVLLSAILTVFLHQFIQRIEKDHLDRNITRVEEVYLPFLIPALWITDYGSLQGQIEGIVDFDYIERVEVRDDRGEVFSAGAEARPSLDVITRNLVYVNRGRSQDIGSVSLFIDRDEFAARVFKRVRVLFFLQLLLSVVLATIIAWVYHRVIGRQLFRVAEFIQADDPAGPARGLTLEKTSRQPVELRFLVDHINKTRGRMESYITEIQEWRSLLQYIVRHDPNAIFVLDRDMRFIFVSEKYLQNNQLEREKVVGRTFAEISPAIYEKWYRVHRRALAGETLGSEQDQLIRPNGALDIIRWWCRPWYEPDGSIGGTVFYSETITERKQMKRALFLEKELFRATLLSVGDGVISTDNEGKVRLMNHVAEKLTGWRAEEAAGEDFDVVFRIVDEWSDERAKDLVRQVLEDDQPVELVEESVLVSREGLRVPIEDRAAPIRDRDGRTTGVVVVFRDCAEKRPRIREIEYLSYNDQLTGLYNRRFFEEELRRLDVPRNLPFSFVMADLNGLKLFNDAFGHTAGDEKLRKVARVLREECRADDIIARVGGDEFVILLPSTGEDHLEPLMGRIAAAVARERVENLPISVSLGGATKTDPSERAEKTLHRAEDQMYRRKISDKSNYHSDLVRLILEALYSRFPTEEAHSKRVARLSEAMGRVMGLGQPKIDRLVSAAAMHDIGKIAIRGEVLEKKGPLDETEREEVKRHPDVGYTILGSANEYNPLAEIVLAHHESWDGEGYPRGLEGEEISLMSRVIAVVEAYDAMVSGRPYREAMSREEAVAELRRCAGTQFDPSVVEVLVEKVLGKGFLFD